MKRELSQKSFEELSFLKEWILTITDFLLLKYPKAETPTLMRQIVTETFEKSNLRGMRMVYKDMNELSKGLSSIDLEELNRVLKERFGSDLTVYSNKGLAKIQRIIKRGRVNTDDEFRLLSNRVDEIYADDSKKDEVEVLNKLMGDYENSKRSKLLKRRS
jgi:hypothetical protein